MKFNEIPLPSNKKIGFFFSFIFICIAIYLFFIDLFLLAYLFISLSLILYILSIIKPSILMPVNKLWMYTGFILGKIISPIIIGIVFFFIFTPVSLIQKLFGRDMLDLNNRKSSSSWKIRKYTSSKSTSFKQQF